MKKHMKNLIMNRKTYEKFSTIRSTEIDKVEDAIHLLNEDKTYKIATLDDGAEIYISNVLRYGEVMTSYKQDEYDPYKILGGANLDYKVELNFTAKEEKDDSIEKDRD